MEPATGLPSHPWPPSQPPQSQPETGQKSARGRSPAVVSPEPPQQQPSRIGTSGGSNTPRRRGNPQSSSPASPHRRPTDVPLTPLSTLTSLICGHADHAAASLQLYRQSHALHRHASERATLALEKLREAQAEVEHAETAREFAREELDRARDQKEEAQEGYAGMGKRVRTLSKSMVHRRVKLAGLSKNAVWNGRLGTIVKLVTEGEDVGRWKVKLDPEWRGRDAEGKRVHRTDTVSDHDESEEGDQTNVVVARAENLELVEEYADEEGLGEQFGGQPSLQKRPASKSAPRSRSVSSQRGEDQANGDLQQAKSRDPEEEEYDCRLPSHHHLNHRPPARDPSIESPRHRAPVAQASPDQSHANSGRSGGSWPRKDLAPTEHYRSASGGYHESPPRSTSERVQWRGARGASRSGASGQSGRSSNSPPKAARKSSPRKSSPYNGAHSGASPDQQYATPDRQLKRSPSNDSERISNAFSRMLLSPVNFAPASFDPDPSDSFRQRASPDERGQHDVRNASTGERQNSSGEGSIGNSFFGDVSSLERHEELAYEENANEEYYRERQNDGHEASYHDETMPDPQLQTYSQEVLPASDNDQAGGMRLPKIVVLPVPEDDIDNPFLSPGYVSASPPHCVGIQNAGVSHVNGVYLLAHPKDEHGNPVVDETGENSTPPLYFRDGPPVLLSDGRQYDMCILRINCPDSPDHVIWFLARVDVDPTCLDVKFADCYYYCRMLRNDDGHGGEREGGCQSPPTTGWNVPKLPPGAEVLRIAQSGSFSTEGGSRHGGASAPRNPQGPAQGLGIGPRPYVDERAEFVSPGMDSGFGGSRAMSKYSI